MRLLQQLLEDLKDPQTRLAMAYLFIVVVGLVAAVFWVVERLL